MLRRVRQVAPPRVNLLFTIAGMLLLLLYALNSEVTM